MITGSPLSPVLPGIREGDSPDPDSRGRLDVIPGGDFLSDIGGALLARQSRGGASYDLLAKSLAPLAPEYDLVFIDTPPTDDTLQLLALKASRWLVVPTKPDKSSIRAIQRIAERVVEARSDEHLLDILGVVLVGVPPTATRVLRDAQKDITTLLGDAAPLFDGFIRDSAPVAQTTRDRGILTHELAVEVEGTPFWASLRSNTPPPKLPGSAPALAADYVLIGQQILGRIASLENDSRGVA